MPQLEVGDRAVDFSLPDHKGVPRTLSEVYRSKNVLLVFNIGFA